MYYSSVSNRRPWSPIYFLAKKYPGRCLLDPGRLLFLGSSLTLVNYYILVNRHYRKKSGQKWQIMVVHGLKVDVFGI